MEEKTYYVGRRSDYLRDVIDKNLNPRSHIFVSSFERLLGMPKDIKIISVGPIEDSREIVKRLISYGYSVQR